MSFDSFVLAAALSDFADEPQAREHADAVEFRMDSYAHETGEDPLDALAAYDGELSIIATNRAAWEGGWAEDGDTRLDALAEATTFPAVEAVDVELRSLVDGDGERVVERAHDSGTTVIASMHDFEATPPTERMGELLGEATDRADVGKLAVTANDYGDVLDLLAVTWEATQAGQRVATMAMGEAGSHSRIVAPLYGSKIGYAPVDPARATAPGQYDLATLAELIDILREGPKPQH